MADASTTEDGRRETGQAAAGRSAGALRFAPIGVLIIAAIGAFYAFGDYLSLTALQENRADLLAWRDANFLLAAAVFMSAYMLVVALSIPGALPMTLAGGFLFGVWPGAPMIIIAATIGAMIIFLAARSSLGAVLRERAGPWMRRVERGFNENSASYLLIIRLTPIVPFFVANVAPALLGVRSATFFWTTALGIAPATAIYAWVGSTLGAALESGDAAAGDIAGTILQPQFLAPILALAALAATPVIIKAIRGKRGGGA